MRSVIVEDRRWGGGPLLSWGWAFEYFDQTANDFVLTGSNTEVTLHRGDETVRVEAPPRFAEVLFELVVHP